MTAEGHPGTLRGVSALVLLVAKLMAAAGMVIGVTVAAERLGPRLGAFIAATPQLAVLTIVFFTIEQGPAFAAESAYWNISGVCATIPMYLGYLAGSRAMPFPRTASIAAGALLGTAAFVLAAALLSGIALSRSAVMPFAAVFCALAAWSVRGLPDTATLRRVRTSPSLVLARAMASAVTVVAVTSAARLLGPKWSGLVTGYPVNGLPVLAILHFHYGLDVVKPIIKIWPAGVFGLAIFNLVSATALPRLGLVAALIVAYAVDLTYLAAVDRVRRWKAARRG